MTDIANMTRIKQVATVFVPVADQDRALEFYRDKLGFEKRADFAYGQGSRWIEVAPPGSAITIALVPPNEGKSAGGGEMRCGVEVDAEIARKGKRRSGIVSIGATLTR